MTVEQRIVHARWLLERQLAWISSADTKGAALVAAYTAVVAVAASFLGGKSPLPYEIGLSCLAGALSLVGLIFALFVFMPDIDAPHVSRVFFGGIASVDCEEFVGVVAGQTEEMLLEDLHKQIHVNARIANAKHWNLRASFRTGAVGLLLWLLAIGVFMALPGGLGP